MAEFRNTRIKKQCIFERVNLAKGKYLKKFKVNAKTRMKQYQRAYLRNNYNFL